jgi:hypothetical protein
VCVCHFSKQRSLSDPSRALSAMSRLITAAILSSTRVQLAVAVIAVKPSSGRVEWKVCTEAVVTRGVDPLLVLERLLLPEVSTEVDVILVHQPEARSMLLRRYAQNTVVLMQPPHQKSRALWLPLVPKEWAPLLTAHWRLADLVYASCHCHEQALVEHDYLSLCHARRVRCALLSSGDDSVLCERVQACIHGGAVQRASSRPALRSA